ncbi:MAG: hypothetical protein QOE03_515, partial [Micromonosporaceae bacterium]|nr:hypothetical protein [Micromonosporaceae bacterium]
MSTGSPRRIALVLASSTGGIGRHVASLAGGLVRGGADVTVYGPADAERQFAFTGSGAGFVPVEIPASPQPRDATAIGRLRRGLRAAAPDIVHAHGLRAGLIAALARPAARPLVVTWHNPVTADGVRGQLYRRIEAYLARTADVTLGASADLVARAVAVGSPDARLAVVAAPELAPAARSAAAVRSELGIAADRPMVLSVGRLHPQKGYDVLIAAASRWRTRQPVPVVVIVGSGPSYMKLAGQVSQQRAPVVLTGHRTDVSELLAAADLAVVTSVWEARQLFAQEAMRSGTPLVATSVGGIPDLVGDAALLISPGDVDAVDSAVSWLLDDPVLRAGYGRRGAARAA